MTTIPRTPAFDSTLGLLRDGYEFVLNRSRQLDTDIFATRLLLRPVVCITGAEAAEVFYEPDRLTRVGALPRSTLRLLQDEGSVTTLDGPAQRHRKRMFMSVMTPDSIGEIAAIFTRRWREALPAWAARPELVLRDEIRVVLTEASCEWVGIPIPPAVARRRAHELGVMVDASGTVGPRNWWGTMLRWRTERWAQRVIAYVRKTRPEGTSQRPVDVLAWHRDEVGDLLDVEIAATELLNLIRPTSAIDHYIAFCALALHEHPDLRRSLSGAGDDALRCFVHEVRRFYPFVPFLGGRVRTPFDWRGHRFGSGHWVILDFYGTNRDPRTWTDPDRFDPSRFEAREGNPFDFIPQGGGDHDTGHRCAGEWLTIAVMIAATRILVDGMRYDVPPQDLTVRLSKMLAEPESGFVIANVRAA